MAGPGAAEAEPEVNEASDSPLGGWTEAEIAPRERPTGKANRLAVTALICALAVPFLLVAGILGAVLGFTALDEIEDSEGQERGKAMAQWAIGLGFVNIVVSVAAITFIVMAVTS